MKVNKLNVAIQEAIHVPALLDKGHVKGYRYFQIMSKHEKKTSKMEIYCFPYTYIHRSGITL